MVEKELREEFQIEVNRLEESFLQDFNFITKQIDIAIDEKVNNYKEEFEEMVENYSDMLEYQLSIVRNYHKGRTDTLDYNIKLDNCVIQRPKRSFMRFFARIFGG
jgi:hypothetical protein